MKDISKIKKELIEELETLRRETNKLRETKTKHKQSEELVREKVEQAEIVSQMILENISEGVAIVDVDGKVVKENKALTKMFDCNTLIGKSITDFIVEQDIPHAIDWMKKLFDTGEPVLDFEFTAITKQGKKFSVIVNNTPLKDEGGKINRFIGVLRDITRRKKAEEALRYAEEKYRSIFDNAVEGIFQTTPVGIILSVNPALAQIFGYDSPEDMVSSVTDIGRQLYVDLEQRKEHLQLLNEKGAVKNFEAQMYRKDGSIFWVSISTRIVRDDAGSPLYFEGFVEDITERKQTEEILKKEQQEIKLIIDSSPIIVFYKDREGKFIRVNKAFAEALNMPEEEFVGKTVFDLYSVKIAQGMTNDDQEVLKTGHPKLNIVEQYESASGIRWVLTDKIPIYDKNGIPEGLIGFAQDITEHKRIEESLKQLMHKHQLILDAAGEGIIGLDLDGQITFANPFAVKTTGYEIYELIGQNLHNLVHYKKPDDAPYPYEECPSYETLKTGVLKNIRDEVFFRKDGISFPVRYTSTPIIEDGVIKGTVVTFRDITERKRLEEQFLQAQKMEAVGHLAGGVAHDFNNILTAIIGYGNLLQMKIKENDPLRAYINQILLSSEKAANLTHGLLAFSRKQIINPRPVNLNDIVKNVEKLLLRLIGEDIELKTMLTEEDLVVMADSGQIEQVLMNLATNARDAMPDGGILTISTEIVKLDEKYLKTKDYGNHGKYAIVSVTDTGRGFDEKTKELIFEPFFTTKERGRGTGLGLAVVYGIVKQHNGDIEVYSELGKGTTFKIYLPMIEAEVEETKERITITPTGGTETVLVAEDNIDVRDFTKTVLEQFGYKVIEAVNGEDAIDRFMENKDKIDFLLLDVIMPKKNGKEVYEAIRKVSPDIKALFLSGYAEDIIHRRGILEEGLTLVLKPISPQELLKKIREMLET